MTEVEADQLRKAVERMHGGVATLVQSVPVCEVFGGETVWEGVVHVFDLTSLTVSFFHSSAAAVAADSRDIWAARRRA